MKRIALFILLLMALFTASGETMSHPTVTSTYITNISTAAEWSEFCATVNGGYGYSGVEVRLVNDITEVSDIVGTSSNCFKGTFDGQGHTITFSKTVTGTTQYTAPFGFIDGATIKNLKVTGTVTSGGRFAGGNCHYTQTMNNLEGTQVFSVTGSENVILAMDGDMVKTQKIIIQ